ncbi:sigma 54-interacting transcriptional regulator [Myxococcota bacterium]|nr:sigma 54-interacting transcriptional regulator [Myxococcota bacterium]
MAKATSTPGPHRTSEETEDAEHARPSESAHRGFAVRVLYTGGRIRREPLRPLGRGRTVIGRAPEGTSTIALPDETRCSRTHAFLDVERTHVLLTDAGSRNGCFVDGVRTHERELRDGDVVRVGDALILVRAIPDDEDDAVIPELVGDAPSTRALRRSLALFGPAPASVLLVGETGTGKELAAEALHRFSGRSGPFVPVNLAAIPRELAESELFGHVPGAFTGAVAEKPGLFLEAHGGTLFLDELGEADPGVQAKLLRAAVDGQIRHLGAPRAITVDVRIVAATNRALRTAIDAGTFRADLYARLAELMIELPPLRARREDVLPILAEKLGPSAPPLAPDLAEALVLHRWPFNVRELTAVAKELTVRGARADVLGLDLVRHRLLASAEGTPPERAQTARDAAHAEPSRRAERSGIPSSEEVIRALELHRGSIADIAKATGRSRTQVYRWLEHHGLDADAYRER